MFQRSANTSKANTGPAEPTDPNVKVQKLLKAKRSLSRHSGARSAPNQNSALPRSRGGSAFFPYGPNLVNDSEFGDRGIDIGSSLFKAQGVSFQEKCSC